MKVHIIDEDKSTEEQSFPLCGADLSPTILKGRIEKQFLTYPNQRYLVDCKECLNLFAKKQA